MNLLFGRCDQLADRLDARYRRHVNVSVDEARTKVATREVDLVEVRLLREQVGLIDWVHMRDFALGDDDSVQAVKQRTRGRVDDASVLQEETDGGSRQPRLERELREAAWRMCQLDMCETGSYASEDVQAGTGARGSGEGLVRLLERVAVEGAVELDGVDGRHGGSGSKLTSDSSVRAPEPTSLAYRGERSGLGGQGAANEEGCRAAAPDD